jgi:8-oxo-dGTP pyrophosphatase MutT (NUDIX family)
MSRPPESRPPHEDLIIAGLQAYAAAERDFGPADTVAHTAAFVLSHPNALRRSCLAGHLTGSAWIVSPDRRRTLLTHHRKLGKWLQLGGHADGDPDLLAVALREAREESGLIRLKPVRARIFDLDRHRIPARNHEPAHWHYDFRFMIEADPAEPLVVSSESKALAWVDLDAVGALNPQESMARMVRKTPGFA